MKRQKIGMNNNLNPEVKQVNLFQQIEALSDENDKLKQQILFKDNRIHNLGLLLKEAAMAVKKIPGQEYLYQRLRNAADTSIIKDIQPIHDRTPSEEEKEPA